MGKSGKGPKKTSAIGVCERCGRPIILNKFTLCYECRALEKAAVDRALNYLSTHRGATLTEIAEAVHVDPQLVLRLIRGGRMETMAQKKLKSKS
jgi:hypothetical protein